MKFKEFKQLHVKVPKTQVMETKKTSRISNRKSIN